MNYADEISIIIDNQAIAEAMRQAYYLSWEGAKAKQLKESESRPDPLD